MTSQEKDLLLSWVVNEEIRLSDEVSQLRQNLRFRKIDLLDCFELAIAMQRYSDFTEFTLILLRLLHIEG